MDAKDKEFIKQYIESLLDEGRYNKVLFSMDDDIGCTGEGEDALLVSKELDTYREAVEQMFGSLRRIGLIVGTDAFADYDNNATSRNDGLDEHYEALEDKA